MSDQRSSKTWANSDAYEAIMGRWSRPAAEAVIDWLNLPPGLDWLDVGCGTGALIETILANNAPSAILGVDPSMDFLVQAQAHIHDPRVSFLTGDADEIPASSNGFDVAISGLVLHFVPDAARAIAEMARAARPGGTVAGYIWAVKSEDQFTRPFWRAALKLDPAAAQWDPFRTHTLIELDRLATLFRAAPLEHVSAADLMIPVTFRDFDDFWLPCLLDGTTPIQRYVHSLSQNQRSALREELRAELPIAADGSIPLRGRLWIARGETVA